jgi:prefoldin subunit 5
MSIHDQYNEDYGDERIACAQIERIKKALASCQQSIDDIGDPKNGQGSLPVGTSGAFLESSAPDHPSIARLRTRMGDLDVSIARLRQEVVDNGNMLTEQLARKKDELQRVLGEISAEVDKLG